MILQGITARDVHGGRFFLKERRAGEILTTPSRSGLHFFENIAKIDELPQGLSAEKCTTDRLSESRRFIIIEITPDSIVIELLI
jgi:hypothetical protein